MLADWISPWRTVNWARNCDYQTYALNNPQKRVTYIIRQLMRHLGPRPGILLSRMRRESKLRRLPKDPLGRRQLPHPADDLPDPQRLGLVHHHLPTTTLPVHAPKLVRHGARKRLPAHAHVADRAPHALHPARLDEPRGRRPQQGRHPRQVRRAQQAGAVVQRARARQLVRGPGYLEHPRLAIHVVVAVHDDVVALVDAHGAADAEAAQRAHDHFRVAVAVEDGGGADDGPVGVAGVVEDCAASGAAAD